MYKTTKKERDRKRPYDRAYYGQNRARIIAKRKLWRDNNREMIQARQRAFYAKHKLEILKKRNENPEKRKEQNQRYYAKAAVVIKRKWANNRVKIINYYSNGKNKCECCGEDRLEFLQIDHIVPREKGGLIGNALVNWIILNNFPVGFQILCRGCNAMKRRLIRCPCRWGSGGQSITSVK